MQNEFYRPVNIEFKVTPDDSQVPTVFGNFKTADEAQKFMIDSLTFMNRQLTAIRYMDNIEKEMKRTEYRNTLEDILPVFEKDLIQAENNLSEAKKKQKDAMDAYNVTMNHAKELAYEVKKGTREMDLDEKYTYRIASKGKYFYFTYIDQQLKLCRIETIPEYEKTELWNQMASNESFFEAINNGGIDQSTGEVRVLKETGAEKFKVFATGPDGVEREIDLAKLEPKTKKAGRPKK